MKKFIISIDAGTTSNRSILFDLKGKPVFSSQKEFTQYFPKSGWVEHNPDEIWKTTIKTLKDVIQKAKKLKGKILSIGITNQRETTVLWDKKTGKPVYRAIVWQDRRTEEFCKKLRKQNKDTMVFNKTGLLIDSYFSGTKIKWILDNVPKARQLMSKKQLLFGTIDSFLIWRLTRGKVHATDATNASRTMIYNISSNRWDDKILNLLKKQKIEAVSLANNHIFDYGLNGFLSTTDALKSNNINYFGAGINESYASAPCLIKISDHKIGFIGFSYQPIAGKDNHGVNNLYGKNIKKKISELKKSVDFVVIMPHSGIELLEYPLPRDQKLYRSMIDAGADLVVGNHPHRVQVMERWKEKRIYYSIGDFIFDHHHHDVWNNFWKGNAHPKQFNLNVDKKIPLESLLIIIEWNKKIKKFDINHVPLLLNKDMKITQLENKEKETWEADFINKNKKFLIQNAMHKKAKSIQRNLKLK